MTIAIADSTSPMGYDGANDSDEKSDDHSKRKRNEEHDSRKEKNKILTFQHSRMLELEAELKAQQNANEQIRLQMGHTLAEKDQLQEENHRTQQENRQLRRDLEAHVSA